MKKILFLAFCAFMLCGCAATPHEETTTSMETTILAEITTEELITGETTTESLIATEITYIESLGETKVKLSTMSEENLRNLLSDAGIEIPEPIKTARLYMLFAMLEEDPEKSSMSYYMIFNTYSVKLRAYAAWDYLPLTEENPALYPKFSEMTDEEIDAFLMKNEIVLPPEIGALDIRAALMSYEKDPLHEIFGEQFPIEEFFDQCRSLMKGYYGIYDPTQDPICMGKPRLSLMSEEECRRILLEGGALILPTHDIQAIRRTVRTCEADPDFIFSFGHYTISELYESIRNAVRAYYGLEPFVYEH